MLGIMIGSVYGLPLGTFDGTELLSSDVSIDEITSGNLEGSSVGILPGSTEGYEIECDDSNSIGS